VSVVFHATIIDKTGATGDRDHQRST